MKSGIQPGKGCSTVGREAFLDVKLSKPPRVTGGEIGDQRGRHRESARAVLWQGACAVHSSTITRMTEPKLRG